MRTYLEVGTDALTAATEDDISEFNIDYSDPSLFPNDCAITPQSLAYIFSDFFIYNQTYIDSISAAFIGSDQISVGSIMPNSGETVIMVYAASSDTTRNQAPVAHARWSIAQSGTSFTLSTTQNGQCVRIRCTSASAVTANLNDSSRDGDCWEIRQCGAGIVTLGNTSGKTIAGPTTTGAQHQTLQVVCIGANSFETSVF
ncbi:MAG: hypothetical protein QM680_13610 [Luteolibacter sp.]